MLNPEELRECKFIDSNLTGSVLMGLDLASCTFTGTNTDGTFRFANTPYAPCDDISELTQPRGDDIGARFRIDGGTDVDVLVYIYSLLAKVKFGEETGTARLPIPALAAALRATNAKLVHLQAERPEVATFWAKVTGKQIELRPSVTVEPDEKMHAMLRDHYDDDNVWSVFADWLVESGDPRGRALRRHLDGSGERCEADVPTIRDMRFRSRRFFVTEVTVESPSVRKPVFMSLVEHPAFALLRSVNYSAFSPQAKHLVQKLPVRKVRCRRPYHSRATFFGTRFVKSIKRAEHLEVLNADGVQVPKKMLRERLPNLKVLRASIAAISDIEVDTLVCESSYPYKNVKARRVGIEKNAPSITSVESYSTSVKHIIESTRGLEEIILVGYLKTPGEVTDDVRKLAKSRGITLTDSVEAIAAFRELL